MPETITNDEVVSEATEQQTEASNQSTQMQDAFWGDKPGAPPTQQDQPKSEEKKEEQPQVNEWWKDYEWDSAETAKTEIAKLKQVKPQEELKFANAESEKFFNYTKEGKLDEAYELYGKQKKITKLLDGEMNESKAADIIKFNLADKYKEFSEADVERKFNKQYGIPKEPIFDDIKETEDEYKARHEEWKEKVAEVKADMILDAKVLKPDLEKIKSELVFPDIPNSSNTNTNRQPTPEELAADKKVKDGWMKAATDFATGFNGFSTVATYKENGKDVTIPVNYGLSIEEKKVVNENVSKFVESGFDPMAILKERWVDKEGNDNVSQVVKDLSWLLFGEKAAQKFANEAHEQRMETYLMGKKNIKVDGSGGKDFGAGDDKTTSEQLQETFWGRN